MHIRTRHNEQSNKYAHAGEVRLYNVSHGAIKRVCLISRSFLSAVCWKDISASC
jgi:hypothetical protein